ncbi:MAG: hypothetical protein IPO77_02995 [Acidobacteria bacterium]|nr:hypothetical protein [Acidobacteriota bacterium]
MSKSKQKREKERKKQQLNQTPDAGRRKLIMIGVGGAGALAVAGFAGYKAGWFGSDETVKQPVAAPAYKALPVATLSPTAENALKVADEYVSHYARELKDPSAVSHAMISFGKKFTLNDGSNVVDFLSKFARENEVNGKKYVYFPHEIEVHENSFLAGFLECNVSPEQQIIAGSTRYTLRDLMEASKALFRCDPQNLQKYDPMFLYRHLPWGLMAFPMMIKPQESVWTNAYGEKIDLNLVIESGLDAFERSCAGTSADIRRGEPESLFFRQEMNKYACFGMHMVYGFFACLRFGYKGNNLSKRANDLFDNVILRMEGDPAAIDRESDLAAQFGQEYLNRIGAGEDGKSATKGRPPALTIEVMRLRHRIRALGHALENINYVRLHNLFSITPDQTRRIEAGEKLLYSDLVKLAAIDMAPFLYWHPKFVSDAVISVSHSSRAMKLLMPNNPDLA